LLPRCRCLLTALRARSLSLSLSLFLSSTSLFTFLRLYFESEISPKNQSSHPLTCSVTLLTETMLVYQQKDLPKDPVFVPDLEKLG
jgi:hypothetical protein